MDLPSRFAAGPGRPDLLATVGPCFATTRLYSTLLPRGRGRSFWWVRRFCRNFEWGSESVSGAPRQRVPAAGRSGHAAVTLIALKLAQAACLCYCLCQGLCTNPWPINGVAFVWMSSCAPVPVQDVSCSTSGTVCSRIRILTQWPFDVGL